jgi:competence protein ComEA
VDPSSTPWRVFDAPAGQPAGAVGARATTADTEPAGSRVPALALAGIAGALLVGGLAVILALGGSGAAIAVGPGMSDGQGTSSLNIAGGAAIVVDVAGAVVAPGVYHLAPGSRIGEAIDAAGGFSPRVDAGRVTAELNLASVLTDGQQVRVPSREDPTTGSGGGQSAAPDGGPRGLIDLNTATQSELESLPGIGPVTAGKIVQARGETPFRTIEELRERGLVGEKTFAAIKALVTV